MILKLGKQEHNDSSESNKFIQEMLNFEKLKSLKIATYSQLISGFEISTNENEILIVLTPTYEDEVIEPEPMKKQKIKLTFEGGEHVLIGDNIILKFVDQNNKKAFEKKLLLPNLLELTYGQIIALGGDFYGIPDYPISDGKTAEERKMRFLKSFQSLAESKEAKKEAEKILEILDIELNKISEAIRYGKNVSEVYEKIGNDLNKKWNVATGGGSFASDLIPPGRYLNLASKNWDHFGKHAELAYIAGHNLALEKAAEAGKEVDEKEKDRKLCIAYAMNAFADHFLSDLFSAGHVRDPRKYLYENCAFEISANLCAKAMHDEDSKFGLNAINSNSDSWKMYGDKKLFDKENEENLKKVMEAVQKSADEIYQAFCGQKTNFDSKTYQSLELIPDLNKLDNYLENTLKNFSPLFVWDGKQVLMRDSYNNLNTRKWTSNWNSLTVAAYLNSPLYKPKL